jgi:hypothetical protein
MVSGDDLLILPPEKVELPPPNGKDECARLSPKQSTFFRSLLNRPNPLFQQTAVEVPLSYAEVFQANLLTTTDINRHENLIYQPGFTPDELRSSVKSMLRFTNQTNQIVADFDPRNIPPEDVDLQTHLALHSLLDERNKDQVAVDLARQAKLYGSNLDCPLNQQIAKLFREQMELPVNIHQRHL